MNGKSILITGGSGSFGKSFGISIMSPEYLPLRVKRMTVEEAAEIAWVDVELVRSWA